MNTNMRFAMPFLINVCLLILCLPVYAQEGDKTDKSTSEKSTNVTDDRAAVERAILDYVEGIYDVKPEYIARSVHSELKKFGYWRPADQAEFRDGSAMTYEQLHKLASEYNKDGQIPKNAPKEIVIFDVMEKVATAKLTAAWGVDYFHLVKEDRWKILQVVWQSQPQE